MQFIKMDWKIYLLNFGLTKPKLTEIYFVVGETENKMNQINNNLELMIIHSVRNQGPDMRCPAPQETQQDILSPHDASKRVMQRVFWSRGAF